MEKLKFDVIIHIDDNTKDDDLYFDKKYVPSVLAERITGSDPEINVYYSVPSGYSGMLENNPDTLKREHCDDIPFWKKFFSTHTSDHVAVINGDSPFFDPGILKEMAGIHTRYLAEFTFSENLPEGFSCEIISRELMDQIPDTDEKTLPLGKVIRANINKFDVELYYKEPDIRSKRIAFRLNSLREKRIMENLYNINNSIPVYSEIKELIESNPQALYIGPSYVEMELTGKCSLDCLFCYRKSLANGEHEHMDSQTFSNLLSGMRVFGLPYTLCFTGSGEPMEHPGFYRFMETALQESLLEQLIIETNGVNADSAFKSFISEAANSRVKVIINNNGLDRDSYRRFHNADEFDRVFKNIVSLAELNSSGERIYIQIMKINETDEFTRENDIKSYLDKYYDFWEGQKIPIILQKQNVYFNRIPDRRYSDLSPVKRTPCWHLQRDLYVLSDGTVSFCKQDIDGADSRWNVNSAPVSEIWNSKKDSFINEFNGHFPENPDCRNCDEWYTFNF